MHVENTWNHNFVTSLLCGNFTQSFLCALLTLALFKGCIRVAPDVLTQIWLEIQPLHFILSQLNHYQRQGNCTVHLCSLVIFHNCHQWFCRLINAAHTLLYIVIIYLLHILLSLLPVSQFSGHYKIQTTVNNRAINQLLANMWEDLTSKQTQALIR